MAKKLPSIVPAATVETTATLRNRRWRNVTPHAVGLGRVFAPDLVGYGRSAKSPSKAYKFTDQVRYLDAWFETLSLTSNVTLVLHDWGSALGFNRVARFSEQIKGIAYMEAIAMVRTWSDFGPAADIFKALKSPKGEKMILDGNFFVEELLPRMVRRTLTEEEKATYRAPFKERDDRLPTLILPRDIPIYGETKDVSAIVDNYGAFLESNLPKLLILAEPGAIIIGRVRDFVRAFGKTSGRSRSRGGTSSRRTRRVKSASPSLTSYSLPDTATR
jgi:haloalkane dehalogenase